MWYWVGFVNENSSEVDLFWLFNFKSIKLKVLESLSLHAIKLRLFFFFHSMRFSCLLFLFLFLKIPFVWIIQLKSYFQLYNINCFKVRQLHEMILYIHWFNKFSLYKIKNNDLKIISKYHYTHIHIIISNNHYIVFGDIHFKQSSSRSMLQSSSTRLSSFSILTSSSTFISAATFSSTRNINHTTCLYLCAMKKLIFNMIIHLSSKVNTIISQIVSDLIKASLWHN